MHSFVGSRRLTRQTFDWIDFLNRHGIPYVDSGHGVVSGNINIKCPWCGTRDPSYHMGIHLTRGVWGCWRDDSHRGRDTKKLVMRLIGCSYVEACRIVGDERSDLSNFQSVIYSLIKHDKTRIPPDLDIPKEFIKIGEGAHKRLYIQYLLNRGFTRKTLAAIKKYYGLYYSHVGNWAGRIIFPIRDRDGILTNWSGRTISKRDGLRYVSLSTNKERSKKNNNPMAQVTTSDSLLFEDLLTRDGGKTLYITEGPFDALKIDVYGRCVGKRATCLFTKNISSSQVGKLTLLNKKFDDVVILLDSSELKSSLRAQKQLSHLSPKVFDVSGYASDPGELTEDQVLNLDG